VPIPKQIARFNTKVTNHVTRPFAAHLPGFAIVRHAGRRSGQIYETPVNMFRSGADYVIALTYGADSQWVKNVMAAGGCEVRTRGHTVRLTSPRVFSDPTRRAVPAAVRLPLQLLDVSDFMSLRQTETPSSRH